MAHVQPLDFTNYTVHTAQRKKGLLHETGLLRSDVIDDRLEEMAKAQARTEADERHKDMDQRIRPLIRIPDDQIRNRPLPPQ